MSDQKNKHAKFSNFEPETDDARIEENWDKIKYFLPREKKWPVLPFFTRSATFILLSVGSLFLGSVAVHLMTKNSFSEIHNTGLPELKNQIVSTKPGLGNTALAKNVKLLESQENYVIPKEKPVPNEKRGQSALLGKHSFPPGISQVKVKSAVGSPISKKSKGALLSHLPIIVSKDSVLCVSTDLWPITPIGTLNLDSILSFARSMETQAEKGAPASDLSPGVCNKLFVELLVGVDPTFTEINNKNDVSKTLDRQINFSIGVGLIYRLKNKWSIEGRLLAGTNSFKFQSETAGNRIVTQPTSALNTTGAGGNTIRYVQIDTKNSMQARYSFNFQAGAGYTFIQKGRFAIKACMQLGLKISSYNYSRESRTNSDTLIYLPSALSNSLTNDANTTGKYSKNFMLLSLGALPGVSFSYRVTERATFVLKSLYFKQVSNTKINAQQAQYNLGQDNLYINLGLQLKL